jgi:hypothetical protein
MTTIQGAPNKMFGRFIGGLLIAGVTRSSSGVFAADTTGTYSGDLHANVNLGGFTYKQTYDMVDTSPVDLFMKDMVPESYGLDVTVTEMRLTSGPCLIEAIGNSFNYFRIQRNFLAPGASVSQVFAAICAISDFDGGDVEKGTMKAVLTGQAAGINIYFGLSSGTIPF